MKIEDFSYTVIQRLRLIDIILDQSGSFNRKILMDYFGISMPQASKDLAVYAKIAPNNLRYDLSSKKYLRAATFKRIWS